MKAFQECDRRIKNKCVQFQHVCTPETQLAVDKCWRMCKENDKFLQCPICLSALWFDNHVTNSLGSGDIFYCPTCDNDVNRSEAIQTFARLSAELKKAEKIVSDHKEKATLSYILSLSPRKLNIINCAKYESRRMKEMIVELTHSRLETIIHIKDELKKIKEMIIKLSQK